MRYSWVGFSTISSAVLIALAEALEKSIGTTTVEA
jgi:hypothetical protein